MFSSERPTIIIESNKNLSADQTLRFILATDSMLCPYKGFSNNKSTIPLFNAKAGITRIFAELSRQNINVYAYHNNSIIYASINQHLERVELHCMWFSNISSSSVVPTSFINTETGQLRGRIPTRKWCNTKDLIEDIKTIASFDYIDAYIDIYDRRNGDESQINVASFHVKNGKVSFVKPRNKSLSSFVPSDICASSPMHQEFVLTKRMFNSLTNKAEAACSSIDINSLIKKINYWNEVRNNG
ncbi:hypothetical protein [Photobacterium kishitanii]|nr:hypothetical protein [Photobacterium kishitanii]